MKKIWEKWKELTEKIGNFQASILFSFLYFVLVVPIGIASSFFSDHLRTREFPMWEKMVNYSSSFKKLKKQ